MDCIYRAYRDLLTNHGHLVERLVCGKMNKQQFLDAEVNLSKKKELLAEKLNQLVASIWEGKEKKLIDCGSFFKISVCHVKPHATKKNN